MRSSNETLVRALRVLATAIQSEDGVANAACAEAAQRIEELAGRWKTGTPPVGEGGMRRYLVTVRVPQDGTQRAGKLFVREANYRNHYEAPLAEWCDDTAASGGKYNEESDQWLWTGWYEPESDHNEQFYPLTDGEVIAWAELPKPYEQEGGRS